MIQQIAERSDGGWRPSPGSVYPTIQQLEDEGLVEADDERGRTACGSPRPGTPTSPGTPTRSLPCGRPFERTGDDAGSDGQGEHVDLESELGQVMPAVWQIVTQGSEAQRRAAGGVGGGVSGGVSGGGGGRPASRRTSSPASAAW